MRINVALIGYGYWGKIIRKYIDHSDKFRLKYIYFRSAIQSGIFINKIDRIWEDDSVNVVIIATPIETHYNLVKSAILAKKNVMCEKPLVTNKKQANVIRDMARKHKVKIVTDFIYTFSPGIKKIKELLERNMIGKIEYMEMRMLKYDTFSSGNVFDILASHHISILCKLDLIEGMNFKFNCHVRKGGIIKTGDVDFKKKNIQGKIVVSLNSPTRENIINIFGNKGFISFNPLHNMPLRIFLDKNYDSKSQNWENTKNYNLDESNTLANVLDYLYNTLVGLEKDNLKMALKVAEVLEKVKGST